MWDGNQLKLTFRRNFDAKLMEEWYQIVEIAKSITLSEDTDSLIWQLENKGHYSTSSLYHVINFRGVQPVFTPAVWQLRVPPKIHVFLWLFANNKLMTRDNLRKRHIIKPLDCVYCTEDESVTHLFFDCVVAKNLWPLVKDYFKLPVGGSFESIARYWVSNKKNSALNTVCSAILWCLWKYRNSMIFINTKWISVIQVWRLVLRTIRHWAILSPELTKERVLDFSTFLARFIQ